MDDRTLLELAAKAAGYQTANHLDSGAVVLINMGRMPTYVWNPLEDDGDAFRLAVKLGLNWESDTYNKQAYVESFIWPIGSKHEGECWECCIYEKHGADPYAATRRAIVRAAAEIGRNME